MNEVYWDWTIALKEGLNKKVINKKKIIVKKVLTRVKSSCNIIHAARKNRRNK